MQEFHPKTESLYPWNKEFASEQELESLQRSFHSLKGGSAMMGMSTLASKGEQLEKMFQMHVETAKKSRNDIRFDTEEMVKEIDELLGSVVAELKEMQISFNNEGITQ